MDFSAIKTLITQNIRTNNNEDITGSVLQQVLLGIIETLGDDAINDLVTAIDAEGVQIQNIRQTLQNLQNGGYLYGGVAVPGTSPGTPLVSTFFIATQAGTYNYFIDQDDNPITLSYDALYILTYEALENHYWEYQKVCDMGDGVYDISANHNGATYADLAAALGTNGANVPVGIRKGGMSVKYVQSDNKYVQYRLMSDTFNTTVANWQGVDDEPTAGSENLIKSGYIYDSEIKRIPFAKNYITPDSSFEISKYINTSGVISDAIDIYCVLKLSLPAGKYNINLTLGSGSGDALWKYSDATCATPSERICASSGNNAFDAFIELEAGYYAISWKRITGKNPENYAKFTTIDKDSEKLLNNKIDEDINNALIDSILEIGEINMSAGGTISMVDGKIVMTQTSANNLIFKTKKFSGHKPQNGYILLKASCSANTQIILVGGSFGSSTKTDNYFTPVEITTTETWYRVPYKCNNIYNTVFVGILSSNINVGVAVTISEMYFISEGAIRFVDAYTNTEYPLENHTIFNLNATIVEANAKKLKFNSPTNGSTCIVGLDGYYMGTAFKVLEFDAVSSTQQYLTVGLGASTLSARNTRITIPTTKKHFKIIFPYNENPYRLDFTIVSATTTSPIEITNLIVRKDDSIWPDYFPMAKSQGVISIDDIENDDYIINRQIAGVMPQSHTWSPYGSGYTLSVDSSTQEVTYGLTAADNSGVTFAAGTNAKPYAIRMRAYSTVNGQKMVVGLFASVDSEDKKVIELSTTPQEYFLHFTGKNANGISYLPSFGVFGVDKNIGAEIHITLLNVSEDGDIATRVAEIAEIVGFTDYPFTNNIDSVFQSINKKDKYLTKICLFGDSLLANDIGGDIPSDVDEGNTKRPMRLLTNNVARRLYDWMSWNKPIWRRFDNADWTKSGFASFSHTGFFFGTQEQYCRATTSGAYMEITIPQGYEHFALIANKKTGMGVLNVTINGNLPSTIKYTNPVLVGNPQKSQQELETLIENNSVVNSSVVPLQLPCGNNSINLAADAGNVGNPYEIYEFHNLPSSQANIIRFTTASATECDVWGGFYWSGNTMVIMDIARGGHTSTQLLQYAQDQLYNVQYDALMWEFPEMNDLQLTLAQSEANFRSMISSLRAKGIDFVFTSCNPLGLSIVHDTNFYAGYTSPTQEDINDKIRSVANELRVPFIDLFKYFEWNIVNKGGSLAGGEGGLWFTWDGQHGNPNGVRLWFEALKKVFEKSPITISD